MNEINYTEELYKEFLNEAGFLDKLKGSVGLGGKKELSPNDLEVLDKNVDALLTSIASEIGSTKENLINDLTNGPSKDLITPEIIQYATQLIDLSNKIKCFKSLSATAGLKVHLAINFTIAKDSYFNHS